MNAYLYANNDAIGKTDLFGLWTRQTHEDLTLAVAQAAGMRNSRGWPSTPAAATTLVASHTAAVDNDPTGPLPWQDQRYHFNTYPQGCIDSRFAMSRLHLDRAKDSCDTWITQVDNFEAAAGDLGKALHPKQDYVAHGDFFAHITENWVTFHNMYSQDETLPFWWWAYPQFKVDLVDNITLDASPSPDRGRPSGTAIIGTFPREWAYFRPGGAREAYTVELTSAVITEFMDLVRTRGGCGCRQFFLPWSAR